MKENIEALTVSGKNSKIGLLCGSHGSPEGDDALAKKGLGIEEVFRSCCDVLLGIGHSSPHEIQEVNEMSSEEETKWKSGETIATVKELRKLLHEKKSKDSSGQHGLFPR